MLMKEFQMLLKRVPEGKVVTYKIIADELGISARHAGKLCSKNPYPVKYPCYKVVNSNGLIGGYSDKDGIKSKIRKLENDGIRVENKRIDLSKHLFKF